MYKDLINILELILETMSGNDKEVFKGYEIYDVYRQFHTVCKSADFVLTHYLPIHLDSINSDTGFGSVEKKFLFFNNKNLFEYESDKHKLLTMFAVFAVTTSKPILDEKDLDREDVFRNNFLTKRLSGRVDKNSKVANIGEDFQMTIYSFNLVTDPNKVQPFRDFEELFVEKKFDLSSQEKRDSFIEETQGQIDIIYTKLNDYEKIMKQYYSIDDLCLIDERNKRRYLRNMTKDNYVTSSNDS